VYLIQVHPENGQVLYQRPDCHLWACPDCAEINKRRWTAIVCEGIRQYQAEGQQNWYFITLTNAGYLRTFNATLVSFRKNWPKFYARWKRSSPNLHYVMLPEHHKDGRLHMHALTSSNLPKRWYKDNGAGCGLGYMNDATPIKSLAHAAFYVTKYVTKTLGIHAWPKTLHRVRTSAGWPKLAKLESDERWEICQASEFESKLANWHIMHWTIIEARSGEIISKPD
jgi:hypothetical protein